MYNNREIVDLVSDDSDSESNLSNFGQEFGNQPNSFGVHLHRGQSEVVYVVDSDTEDEVRNRRSSSLPSITTTVRQALPTNPPRPAVLQQSPVNISTTQSIHRNQSTDKNPYKKQKTESSTKEVVIKKEYVAVGFGEADIPGEVVEVRNPFLSHDSPSAREAVETKSILESQLAAKPLSTSTVALSSKMTLTASKSLNDDDDDAIEYVGGNMAVASEMPHAREACPSYPFNASNARACMSHCTHCYCYVCEVRSAECPEWDRHCMATYKVAAWKRERSARQSRLMRLLPPVHQKAFFNMFRPLLEGGPSPGQDSSGDDGDWGSFSLSIAVRLGQSTCRASNPNERLQSSLDECRKRLVRVEASCLQHTAPLPTTGPTPVSDDNAESTAHLQCLLVQAGILFVGALKLLVTNAGFTTAGMEPFTELLVSLMLNPHSTQELRNGLLQELQSQRAYSLIALGEALVQATSNSSWLQGSAAGAVPSVFDKLSDSSLLLVLNSLFKTNTSDVLSNMAAKLKDPKLRFRMIMSMIKCNTPVKAAFNAYASQLLRGLSVRDWTGLGVAVNQLDMESLSCLQAEVLLRAMLPIRGANVCKMRLARVAFTGCLADDSCVALTSPVTLVAARIWDLMGRSAIGSSSTAPVDEGASLADHVLSLVCQLMLGVASSPLTGDKLTDKDEGLSEAPAFEQFAAEPQDKDSVRLILLVKILLELGYAHMPAVVGVDPSVAASPVATLSVEEVKRLCCQLTCLLLEHSACQLPYAMSVPRLLVREWGRLPSNWTFGVPPNPELLLKDQWDPCDGFYNYLPMETALKMSVALAKGWHEVDVKADPSQPAASWDACLPPPSRHELALSNPMRILWKSFIQFIEDSRQPISASASGGMARRAMTLISLIQSTEKIFSLLDINEQATAASCLRRECASVWGNLLLLFALRDFSTVYRAVNTLSWYAFFRKMMRLVRQVRREVTPGASETAANSAVDPDEVDENPICTFWRKALSTLANSVLDGQSSAVCVILQDTDALAAHVSRSDKAQQFVGELQYLRVEDVTTTAAADMVAGALKKIMSQSSSAAVAQSFVQMAKSSEANGLLSMLTMKFPELIQEISLMTLSPDIIRKMREVFKVCAFDDNTSSDENLTSSSATFEQVWQNTRQKVAQAISCTLSAPQYSVHDSGMMLSRPSMPPRVYAQLLWNISWLVAGRTTSPEDAMVCAALLSLDDLLDQMYTAHFKSGFTSVDDYVLGAMLNTTLSILLAAASVHSLLRYMDILGDWIRELSMQERHIHEGVRESVPLGKIVKKFKLEETTLNEHTDIVLLEFWIYFRPSLHLLKLFSTLTGSPKKNAITHRICIWLSSTTTQSCLSQPDFIESIYMFLPTPDCQLTMEGLIYASAEVPLDVSRRLLGLALLQERIRPHMCHMLVAWCFQSQTVPAAVRAEITSYIDKISKFSGTSINQSGMSDSILPLGLSTSVLRLISQPSLELYKTVCNYEEAGRLKERLLGMCFDASEPLHGVRILLLEREFIRLFKLICDCSTSLSVASKMLGTLTEAIDTRFLRSPSYIPPLASASTAAEMERVSLSLVVEFGQTNSFLRQLLHYLLTLDAMLSDNSCIADGDVLKTSLQTFHSKVLNLCAHCPFITRYLACCSYDGFTLENMKHVSGTLLPYQQIINCPVVLGDMFTIAARVSSTAMCKVNLFREYVCISQDEFFAMAGLSLVQFHMLAAEALLCAPRNSSTSASTTASASTSACSLVQWFSLSGDVPVLVPHTVFDRLTAVVAECGPVAAFALEPCLLRCLSSSHCSMANRALCCKYWRRLVEAMNAAVPGLRYLAVLFELRDNVDYLAYRNAAHCAQSRYVFKGWLAVVSALLRQVVEGLRTSPASPDQPKEGQVRECLKIALDATDNSSLWLLDRQTAVELVASLFSANRQLVIQELCKLSRVQAFAVGPAAVSNEQIRQAVSKDLGAVELLQEHAQMAGLWDAMLRAGCDDFLDFVFVMVSNVVEHVDKERVSAGGRSSFVSFMETMKALLSVDAASICRWLHILNFVKRKLTRKKTVLAAIKQL